MFVLLRQLDLVRRAAALRRPERARSLAVRHVDAGSCNACEHELTAASSPYYDVQRFGIDVVASPRHADVLLITGPVTDHMREPLLAAYAAMPEPRLVAALGDCALGCGVLGSPDSITGAVADVLAVDIRIPGCPPPPDVIADRLLAALDAGAQLRAR